MLGQYIRRTGQRDGIDQAPTCISADDAVVADRLYDIILERRNQVALQPYSAPEVQINQRIYRKLYVHPCTLYYRIIHNKIIIMCILHERIDKRKYL